MTAIIISIALMAVTVGLDQLSKYLVVANMELYQSIEVIPGVLNFTYIHNDGAAFGSMDEHRWVFMVLSSVAIIGILVYMFWKKPKDKLLLASLIMVTGGGIGNMIDRISLGYVVDFIDFCAFPTLWMWIFNIADSFVCVGAGCLALWMILDTVREMKKEKMQKLVCANAEKECEGDIETQVDDENNSIGEENE